MSQLKEKVAFLKGMVSGLDFTKPEEQKKMIENLIHILDEFASEINSMQNLQIKLQRQINDIDEDLEFLEEEVYENSECEDELIEIACPHCEEIITLTEEEISEDGEVECPACHKEFEVEWECDDCIENE